MKQKHFLSAVSIVSACTVLVMNALLSQPVYAAVTPGKLVSYKGTVYVISSDYTRRPFTSRGAFESYDHNSFAQVVPATTEDLSLPLGSFMPPAEGKIFCSDRGADKSTCYVMSAGQKFGFTSEKAFKDQGYSFDTAIYGDVSWVKLGGLVNDGATAHVPGSIIQDNGSYKYIQDDKTVLTFPDFDTVKSWDNTSVIVPANTADRKLSSVGTVPTKQPGQQDIWKQRNLSTGWVTNTNNTQTTQTINQSNTTTSSQTETNSLTVTAGQVGASSSIYNPISIDNQIIPDGVEGTPYELQFTASGGTGPYVWTITHDECCQLAMTQSGRFGYGKSDLHSTVLMPVAQTFSFEVTVTDSKGAIAKRIYPFRIKPTTE